MREHELGRDRERIPSRLCAVSAEANMRLEPMNREITTWAKIKSQTLNRLSHPGAQAHIFKCRPTWILYAGFATYELSDLRKPLHFPSFSFVFYKVRRNYTNNNHSLTELFQACRRPNPLLINGKHTTSWLSLLPWPPRTSSSHLLPWPQPLYLIHVAHFCVLSRTHPLSFNRQCKSSTGQLPWNIQRHLKFHMLYFGLTLSSPNSYVGALHHTWS